ncbi:MAG: hypothetical protein PHD00_01190 [Bacteroidales bacterium]|nr:hypothetical protein [Bacteroidales bacterium]MDD4672165.1 hypothetical protein [Bacteroidales bacterium]MDY0348008.1 hypothetical protein [Tenuifilaceae bacterium]
MQFYEPGPYEEFVGKISTAKVKPPAAVWHYVSQQLDDIQRKKRVRFLYWVSAYAASFLLIGGLSLFFLLKTDTKYVESFQIAELSAKNLNSSPPPTVSISNLSSPLPIPVSDKNREVLVQLPVEALFAQGTVDRLEPMDSRLGAHFSPQQGLQTISKLKPPPQYISTKKPTRNRNLSKASARAGWTLALYTNPYFSSNTSIIMSQSGVTKEMGLWMWGGEVQLMKRISENVGLVFGLAVNPTGQRTLDLAMFNDGRTRSKDVLSAITSYGTVTVATPDVATPMHDNGTKSSPVSLSDLSQYIYHIEIPFMLTTKFNVDRVGVEFRFGGAAGMLVHNKFEVHNEHGNFVGETQGVKPYSVSAISAVSISIPLVNKLSLVVEPYFRLGLVSFNNQANSTTYPFNASVRFGLGYSF